ncbi:PREDICTED: PWWP domain-containing protein 2A-like [Priapulus caudatus]|uniref:PWWP domain-containing protein 2A-like n=1 Tax=Priapulus caudatus TaxID=37621 RepID=A0ABM1DNL8_PRICU|nr:PREDICTED: PWWP domain-containing protein 2A-like [Priapulus caudatus]
MAGETLTAEVMQLEGSSITVNVVKALEDVIVVSYIYATKVFQGVLLDSSKRCWPHGLNIPNFHLAGPRKEEKAEEVKPELNAINYRHTYDQQCIKSQDRPGLIQSKYYPRNSLLKGKGFRPCPMRLRPRQVFCSKCKSVCTENSENVGNATTAVGSLDAGAAEGKPSENDAARTPKKLKKSDGGERMHRQASPIIKISFSNPEGKGTVMKIARRSHDYADDLTSPTNNLLAERPVEHVHRKKAKHHHKHKMKRKKRHRHQSGQENSGEESDCAMLARARRDNSSSASSVDGNSSVQFAEARVNLKRLPESELSSLTPPEGDDDDDDDDDDGEDGDELEEEDEEEPQRGSGTAGHDDATRDGPPDGCSEEVRRVEPLMMRIQSHAVDKCVTPAGKTLAVGDVVWGKIHGFPWWPGHVIGISESTRDNGSLVRQLAHVAWFASTTSSTMSCSELLSFIENFHGRFNKKKKGSYKEAVRQAMLAAQAHRGKLHDIDVLS